MKKFLYAELIIGCLFLLSQELCGMVRFKLIGRAYASHILKKSQKNSTSPRIKTVELIEQNRPLSSLDATKNNSLISVPSPQCTAIVPYKETLPFDNIIEQACFIIKPDAVVKAYVDPIIKMIQDEGFSIGRLQKRLLTKKEVEDLYEHHKNQPFFNQIVQHMTSACCFVLTVSKKNGIYELRKLIGSLEQDNTLRGEFGSDKTANAVHGSDSPEAAQREIKIFFKDE